MAGLAGEFAVNLGANAVQSVVTETLAPPDELAELLRGLITQSYQHHLFPKPVVYTFLDIPITLQANVELELDPDMQPGLTHVSIFPLAASTPVAAVLRGHGVDIAINLVNQKWNAIEVPTRTRIMLPNAAASVGAVLRYANERWGAILP